MQFLLDNLIAATVVLTLTLLLVSTTVQRQDESVGLANHRAQAGRTASVAATVRRDLESLSSVTAVSDSSFDFTVALDPAATPVTMGSIRYRRRLSADGSYRVVRIDEAGAERAIGPPMRDWEVDLLDATHAETSVVADGRRVRVRMVTAPAFAQASDTLNVVWEQVFTPALLGSPTL